MKLKLVIVICFLFCQNNFAQKATQAQIEEVKQELSTFKRDWSKKVPFDDERFGIIQLSSSLNLEFPGMEKVKKAVAEEKWELVEKELLSYFKDKYKNKTPKVGKLFPRDIERSESALNHYFRGNGDTHPLIYRGENINWISSAYHEGKEIKDREWLFQYLRLTWWDALGKAYVFHKDDAYFHEWQYEMVDISKDILPITDSTPWHIRRGMETYNRTTQLRVVLPYFIENEKFDSKTLLYFLSSFYAQAEHIRTKYAKKGNHLLGELINVFENGIYFPEFKKSEEWKQDAITKIPERMFIEIFSDGMNNEFVFSYHSMYMDIFSKAYVAFKKYGYENNLPKAYRERLQKMTDIYMHQMFPDNTISQFGDSWKHRNPAKTYGKMVSRFDSDAPYKDFISSRGKKGNAPTVTSVAYPESGFYFFRSNWTKDAVYMSMKNNPGYSWHSQYDNGNFELYAYGRNLMNDSGSYTYESSDPKIQDLRKWFKSSKVHQTLTLDNKNSKHDTEHVFWKKSDDLTCLVNDNQSYDNLKHRRTTLFIENKYFLIYDQAIGDAEGKVDVHFQLVPSKIAFNKRKLSVATKFGTGANLIVKSFPTDGKVAMNREDGWISYKILKKSKRPAWSYSLMKEDSTNEVSFLTALLPYKENEQPYKIKASVEKKGDKLCFKMKVDKKKYRIILDIKNQEVELIKK